MKYRYRTRTSERPVANRDPLQMLRGYNGTRLARPRGLMDGRVFVDDVYGCALARVAILFASRALCLAIVRVCAQLADLEASASARRLAKYACATIRNRMIGLADQRVSFRGSRRGGRLLTIYLDCLLRIYDTKRDEGKVP